VSGCHEILNSEMLNSSFRGMAKNAVDLLQKDSKP
jgi:hypothetical protein